MRNLKKAFSLAEAGIYENEVFNDFSFKELGIIMQGVERRKARRLMEAVSNNIGSDAPIFGVDLSLGELLIAGAYCGRVIRGEQTMDVPLTNPVRSILDKYGISIN